MIQNMIVFAARKSPLRSRAFPFKVAAFIAAVAFVSACTELVSPIKLVQASDHELRIMVVMGTRPDVIKLAPVIRGLKNFPEVLVIVCLSGQHADLVDTMLGTFGIHIDAKVDTLVRGQSLTASTARSMLALERVLLKWRPDIVVVQGDTTTALCASLAASYEGITVAHVEAGLRTYDAKEPFPEEINRQVISVLAAVHFAPTDLARDNLIREGFPASSVHVTGNSVVDSALWMKENVMLLTSARIFFADRGILFRSDKKYILLTTHRRENFDKIAHIMSAVSQLCVRYNSIIFLLPLHPNPRALQKIRNHVLATSTQVLLLPPLTYEQVIFVLSKCFAVLTDSGGLQEEASVFRLPVVVLRDVTERTEGVIAGVAFLSGSNPDSIARSVSALVENKENVYTRIRNTAVWPYGKGTSGLKMSAVLATVPRQAVARRRFAKLTESKSFSRFSGARADVIGIVLPLFNAVTFVKEAVRSVLRQTDRNWLLVVVDDGSSDGTSLMVRSLVRTDNRVCILSHGANKGLAASLNHGLEWLNGRCKYVTWISGDNFLKPNFLSSLRELASQYPEASVVTASFDSVNERGRVMGTKSGHLGTLRDTIFHFQGCAAFLWMPEFGIRFDTNALFSEDYGFWIDLLLESPISMHSNATLLGYRHHKSSLSSKYGSFWKIGWRILAEKALNVGEIQLAESLHPGLRFCSNHRACLTAALLAVFSDLQQLPKLHVLSKSWTSPSNMCSLVLKLYSLGVETDRFGNWWKQCSGLRKTIQGSRRPKENGLQTIASENGHVVLPESDLQELLEKEYVLHRSREKKLVNLSLVQIFGLADAQLCVEDHSQLNPLGFFSGVIVIVVGTIARSGRAANQFFCFGEAEYVNRGELSQRLRQLHPSVVRASLSMCDLVASVIPKNLPLICTVCKDHTFRQALLRVDFFWTLSRERVPNLMAQGIDRSRIWHFGVRVNTSVFRPSPSPSRANISTFMNLFQNERFNIFYARSDSENENQMEKEHFELLVRAAEQMGPEWSLFASGQHVQTQKTRFIGGKVLRKDLPFMYNFAAVVCISSYSHNFLQTILEALACGARVVLIPRHDRDQHIDGVILPNKLSVNATMDALHAASDPASRKRLIRAGLEIARKASPPVMDRREIELYRVALTKPKTI